MIDRESGGGGINSPPVAPSDGPNVAVAPCERPEVDFPESVNFELGDGASPSISTREFYSAEELLVDTESSQEFTPEIISVKAAPPWMISLLVHMTAMIVLGIFVIPAVVKSQIQMEVKFSEKLGEQIKQDVVISTAEDVDHDQSFITPNDLPPVEDPLLRPTPFSAPAEGVYQASDFMTPNIGVALTGREPGMKNMLLLAYGGDETTENAVRNGLLWLKRNQRSNGTWSLRGPYADAAFDEDVTSATAMALIAFLGAGNTHLKGEFKEVVAKGWNALVRMQKQNGDFWNGSMLHYRLYAQAQATIAACELFGMTKDSSVKLVAQRAIDYAVTIQAPEGGWRYQPGVESDTSVTGWFVIGLQSAQMGGLEIPAQTWSRVSKFLDSVAQRGGAVYRYQRGRDATYPMTAEGLLCRQYLGWKKNDPRLQSGIRHLTVMPMDWDDKDVYYWYYATQVFHHMGGRDWEIWNTEMKSILPPQQTKEGAERGSWSPSGDKWGTAGGRLYTTCLSIYMLEVYYRHLPIYESIYE